MAEPFDAPNDAGPSKRTIAWLQNYRRLCIRWEKSHLAFQGFLHMACALLLIKEVLG
jgi:hypothetical protein